MWIKKTDFSDEVDVEYQNQRRLGHEALNNRDISASIKHFQEAAALKPNLAEAWLSLGHALSASGDSKRSTLAFFRCLSVETEVAAKKHGLQDFLQPYVSGSN